MTAAAWPQNYSVVPYRSRYRFTSDLFQGAGAATRATMANDTDVKKAGVSSLRVSPDGTGVASVIKNITATTPMDLSSGLMRIRFNWPTMSGFRSLAVVLSNGTNATNAHQFSFNANIVRAGWNYLSIPISNRNPTHKPLGYTTAVYGAGYDYKLTTNFIEIDIDGSPTTEDVVYLDSIDTGSRSRCKVVFGTDSADSGMLTNAVPVMSGYGWVGYNAMAQVWSDAGQLLNLESFRAAGWETVNHSYAHSDYTAMTAFQIAEDFRQNDQFLAGLGFFGGQPAICRNFFAYPFNATNKAAAEVLSGLGVVSAREFRNPMTVTDDFGIDNQCRIGAIEMGSAYSLAYNKGLVDFAVSQGVTLFVFGHEIVAAGPTATQWTIADCLSLLAHIRMYEQQGLLDVVSWSDWYLGLTQPALVA